MRPARHSKREREKITLFGVRSHDEPVYGCSTQKIGYRSKARAKRALKEAQRKGGSHSAIYDCPLCVGWHLTSRVR